MTQNPLLDRISVNPNICFGKPCIRGTRIWVSLILDMLAAGDSEDDILQSYPHLTLDDIRACIAYGAAMSLQPEGEDLGLTHFASEKVLSKDWLTEKEDEAWQNLI